jgi:CrcB protein
VLIAALVDRHTAPAWLRIGLVLGVVGGYTTFSTYAQETLDLLEENRVALALTYSLGTVALGVVAVYVGLKLGRLI